MGSEMCIRDRFYRRFLRSPNLPALPRNYTDGQISKDESRRGHYNRQKAAKTKPASYHWTPQRFKVGDRILMQDCAPTGTKIWNRQATVTEVRDSGESYMVEDEDGSKYARNKRFLKLDKSKQDDEEADTGNTQTVEPHDKEDEAERHVTLEQRKKGVSFSDDAKKTDGGTTTRRSERLSLIHI